MNPPLNLRVHAMRYEAQGIVSVELRDVDGKTLPEYAPGAHIELHLGNGLVRSYSLCGAPEVRDRYVVGVLLDRNSRGGSRYVHEQLRVGSTLKIGGPRNHFELDETAPHTVLVAGGIGVTPIVCMARRLAEQGKAFSMLYCARYSNGGVGINAETLASEPARQEMKATMMRSPIKRPLILMSRLEYQADTSCGCV